MGLTLALLIERAKPTSADEIAELDAILAAHGPAAGTALADLVRMVEHPIAAAARHTEQAVVHTAESVFAHVTHWAGDEIRKLEDALKGHPNRAPDPAPADCPDCGYPNNGHGGAGMSGGAKDPTARSATAEPVNPSPAAPAEPLAPAAAAQPETTGSTGSSAISATATSAAGATGSTEGVAVQQGAE